jgi:hypothetical protein
MHDFIKYLPDALLEDIVMSRSVPVIGAGFSKNANLPSGAKMPDWEELGKEIAKLIPNYEFTNPIDAISAFTHQFSKIKLVEYSLESEEIYFEPKRLLEKKEYRAAVISAFMLLESELKEVMINKLSEKRLDNRSYPLIRLTELTLDTISFANTK